jgi:hypothetical protein
MNRRFPWIARQYGIEREQSEASELLDEILDSIDQCVPMAHSLGELCSDAFITEEDIYCNLQAHKEGNKICQEKWTQDRIAMRTMRTGKP